MHRAQYWLLTKAFIQDSVPNVNRPYFRLFGEYLRDSLWLRLLIQPLSQWSNCCRSRKCILWHIPVHAIFAAVFYIFFLPVLSRSPFTSRTPNKDQKTEQLFYFLLVQVPSPGDIHELRGKRFCACYSQALTKSKACTMLMSLVCTCKRIQWNNNFCTIFNSV